MAQTVKAPVHQTESSDIVTFVVLPCQEGRTTKGISTMLAENNVITVQPPANCTDELQPIDVAIINP